MTTAIAGVAAPFSLRRHARLLQRCVTEARPIVLAIYTTRFTAAFALTHSISLGEPPVRLPLALLTWLFAAGGVYLFDGVMDVSEDRLNASSRPIARGALPIRYALAVSLAWASLAIAGAIVLGAPFTYLIPVVLLLGFAYSGPPLRLKRWSPAAGAIVLVAGLLTFLAGAAVNGTVIITPTLTVFAVALSCWMGFVGAVAKDFSDVIGDALTGRRTCAVVKGVRYAAWRLSLNAFLVAAGFLVGALVVDGLLLWPAAVVTVGAVAVALGCRTEAAKASPRRPYRAFMVTQYLAHAAVVPPLVWA